MQSTGSQRLTGLGLLVAGSAATWWQWHVEARIELELQAAFLFPFSTGVGLLLLVQPISRGWLLEHYGVDRPHRLGHYSWPQRLLFVLAMLAGLLNAARELLNG